MSAAKHAPGPFVLRNPLNGLIWSRHNKRAVSESSGDYTTYATYELAKKALRCNEAIRLAGFVIAPEPAHAAAVAAEELANRISAANAKTNAAMTPKEKRASDRIVAAIAKEARPFGWYCELVHEQTGEVIRASFFRDAPLEGPDDVAGFVWRATPVAAIANASGGAAA